MTSVVVTIGNGDGVELVRESGDRSGSRSAARRCGTLWSRDRGRRFAAVPLSERRNHGVSEMSETADVIVVGAGVQGASVAFHLARRGASVLVLERATIASGATGRSSGFVRMHYDLESDARLAWASFPYFRDWGDVVGAGDCGFVRTGFMQAMPERMADRLRANVEMQQSIGIPTRIVDRDEVATILPGAVTDDLGPCAYEPESGYADPSGTTAGFLAAARDAGGRLVQGCTVHAVAVEGDRVIGVDTDRGRFLAPNVINVGGAWAAQLAATVGVDVPIESWRHATAYFGLPAGHGPDFPIVIDEINQAYF
jgi:sarcosine oxidase subunit beta